MTIHTLPLGAYQANCYILAQGSACILIDPGADAAQIMDFLDAQGLKPEAVLLTHGHFDHVGAARAVATEADCPLYLHPGDHQYGPEYRQWFPLAGSELRSANFLQDGQTLHLAGLEVSVLGTPGHTMGSVCFCAEDALFSGDTLFSGSIGRTDLAGGNMALMQASLERLKDLSTNYTVYPGHGPKTTLEREKRVNPYLR